MQTRNRLRTIWRYGLVVLTAALVTVPISAGHASAAAPTKARTVSLDIRSTNGTLLTHSVRPRPADLKTALATITCYVDDTTAPFRIANNIAYQSALQCDAPVVSATYLEQVLPFSVNVSYFITGSLTGPLTAYTRFNPALAPCVNDTYVGEVGVTVQLTPTFSLVGGPFYSLTSRITDC